MKKSSLKFLGIAVCCLMLFPMLVGFAPQKTSLKVATWNILHGNDVLQDQQKQLLSMDAHIVALQEVDEKTERVDGKSCLGVLGQSRYYFRRFGKAMDYQDGAFGFGLLSKYYLRNVITSLTEGGSLARDGIMKAEIVKDGHRISVYNVHFSFEYDTVRTRQIQLVADLFAADPNRYKVIMGDFNVKSLEEFAPFAKYCMLSTKKNPLETYHGDDWDTKCIDNIIYTETLVLQEYKMVISNLSDHNALMAEFQMQ